MNTRQFLSIILLFVATSYAQFRVKDVADVQGISSTQLVGYGLVVGLAGTGDGAGSAATLQSTVNLLRNMGLEVDARQLRLRNVASVLVTANMPAFSKPGGKMDIQVSSMGDARSLSGGVLLQTCIAKRTIGGETSATNTMGSQYMANQPVFCCVINV